MALPPEVVLVAVRLAVPVVEIALVVAQGGALTRLRVLQSIGWSSGRADAMSEGGVAQEARLGLGLTIRIQAGEGDARAEGLFVLGPHPATLADVASVHLDDGMVGLAERREIQMVKPHHGGNPFSYNASSPNPALRRRGMGQRACPDLAAGRRVLLLGVAVEPELDLGVALQADVALRGGDDDALAARRLAEVLGQVDLDDQRLALVAHGDVLHDVSPLVGVALRFACRFDVVIRWEAIERLAVHSRG